MDIDKLTDKAMAVIDGHGDAAAMYAELYALQSRVKDLLDMVKPVAVDEVAKYGKDGVVMNGYTLTTKAGGGRWNYKTVSAHASIMEKVKEIEALAQAAYKGHASIADRDGVLIEPAQYFAGSDTVVCTRQSK